MLTLFCPACRTASPAGDGAPCVKCGAPLLLGARYALLGPPPPEAGTDVVDGAAPLWEGRDMRQATRVLIRLAPVTGAARLEREATVLRGLSHPRLPRVLDDLQEPGVGRALVLSHPGVTTLEAATGAGLRVDASAARRFLTSLLETLEHLHVLSPPVIHRSIHPLSVRWDGVGDVFLEDFARATDVKADAHGDPVLARSGYAPNQADDPVALDLFGACLLYTSPSPRD